MTSHEYHNLTDSVREFMRSLKNDEEVLYGTGLDAVDKAIGGGVGRGEVAILGARPSHGKTLLGLQWCYEVAKTGTRCLIVSEEMAVRALAERVVLFASERERMNWRDEWDGTFDDAMKFMDIGNRSQILVAEPCRTVLKTVEVVKHAASEKGVRFVVVDYAQLIRGTGTTRYEQQCDVSTRLKQAAVDADVAMVVCAQLSRSFEADGKGIPKLHHIKESGQWEQDCDVALMPVWPHRLNSGYQPATEYRVHIAKCRNRGIRGSGVEQCKIDPSRQRILDDAPFSGSTIVQDMPNHQDFGDYSEPSKYEMFPE